MLRDTPTSAEIVDGCYNSNWKNPFSVQVLFSLHHLSGSYSLPIVRYFLVLKWSIASISHPNHTPILGYITNIHSSLSLLNSFFLPSTSASESTPTQPTGGNDMNQDARPLTVEMAVGIGGILAIVVLLIGYLGGVWKRKLY